MGNLLQLSRYTYIGMWPSGKAPGFGPGIRGFESLHPSHGKCPDFIYEVWAFSLARNVKIRILECQVPGMSGR